MPCRLYSVSRQTVLFMVVGKSETMAFPIKFSGSWRCARHRFSFSDDDESVAPCCCYILCTGGRVALFPATELAYSHRVMRGKCHVPCDPLILHAHAHGSIERVCAVLSTFLTARSPRRARNTKSRSRSHGNSPVGISKVALCLSVVLSGPPWAGIDTNCQGRCGSQANTVWRKGARAKSRWNARNAFNPLVFTILLVIFSHTTAR